MALPATGEDNGSIADCSLSWSDVRKLEYAAAESHILPYESPCPPHAANATINGVKKSRVIALSLTGGTPFSVQANARSVAPLAWLITERIEHRAIPYHLSHHVEPNLCPLFRHIAISQRLVVVFVLMG